MIAQDFFPSK